MARPLTKKSKEGELYTRPPAVETQINEWLLDDLPTLNRRLLVTDKTSPDHLRSETLVHFIREAHRNGDDARRDATLRVLFRRCETILSAKIHNDVPNAEALREDILSELGELIALDGTGEFPDELDFYECRFNLAFRTLRLDSLDREFAELDRVADLPDETESEDPADPEDVFARLSGAFRTPANQEGTVFLGQLLAAINALPPDEREAVVLVHVMGYDQESDDPRKETAATRCRCEGRTIRNRLARAAVKLSRFKETS